MAKGVNKVLLLGNVGKDPEIRASQGGMTIASFTLATADRQKDQTGQWADKTEWHNLVAFGRTAEIVRDYVKKGTQIFVEGKIQTRSWDDKESGQKKYRTEILVNDMSLLGGRNSGDGSGGGDRQGSYASSGSQGGGYGSGGNYAGARANTGSGGYAQPANDFEDQGITDEDIPF
jgi:single-strand DNA-binding protein